MIDLEKYTIKQGAYKNKNVNELTPEQLKSYFLYCINSLEMKEAKMNRKKRDT